MNTPFKNLLIATDGSTCSEKAVRVGLELASRLGAKVELVNVLEYGQEPADAEPPTRLTLLHNIDRHHGKLALEQASQQAQSLGVPFKTLQPSGFPERVILEKAQDFELIVLGTHGCSGLQRWMMGSVAEAVMVRSPKPVLVVHESFTPKEPEAHRYKRILIATDGSDCSEKATRYGLELAQTLKAEVTFLYVVSEVSRPMGSALPLAEALGLIEENLQTQAKAVLGHAQEQAKDIGVSAQTKLAQGRPRDCILEEAGTYDLLVMGTHGRTGLDRLMLGSVTEGVVRRSKTPVLVVPRRELE